MALILCIETSSKNCSVCISNNGEMTYIKEQMDDNYCHGEKLHVLIQELLHEANLSIHSFDAFCLSAGPGSYTGLRIGAATLKGFSFATNKPIIAISSLMSLAYGFFTDDSLASRNLDFADPCHHSEVFVGRTFLCPVIDSRQEEVYTALYAINSSSHEKLGSVSKSIFSDMYCELIECISPSPAHINSIFDSNSHLTEDDFGNNIAQLLAVNCTIFFFGSGTYKIEPSRKTTDFDYAHFECNKNYLPSAKSLCLLAEMEFKKNNFVNSAYFEPLYLKDFVPTISKKNKF
ncbi:MAG: tRNA (adenosine(37)-N6)-threonylcarbamoyltransferase complex dimerization subunit type 1 TsaB [Flavobacteriales bacterium]|nr:tRNA (adenosine(37)-N6)-threonylcarbamoyltransferase complex dimerization subunit type 1 TsaB [Flavobacteriales bacterium]